MENRYRSSFLLVVRLLLFFTFTSAAIFRGMNFGSAVEEFALLGAFAAPSVILVIIIELLAALAFLLNKWIKEMGLILSMIIVITLMIKFSVNWSSYLQEFPKVFAFDDTVHNLIYHFALMLIILFVVIFSKKKE